MRNEEKSKVQSGMTFTIGLWVWCMYSAESLSEVVHSQKEYYIRKWQYKNIPMLFIMIFKTLHNLNLLYVKHL